MQTQQYAFRCIVCKMRDETKKITCKRCEKTFCDKHVAVLNPASPGGATSGICRRCFQLGDLTCSKCGNTFSTTRQVVDDGKCMCDTCGKPVIVFFPGFNMPLKRYESFLEKVGEYRVYDKDYPYDPSQTYVAVAHSIGIYEAIYFSDKYKVKTIVSLDGSSLRDELVQDRLGKVPDAIKALYVKWLEYSKTHPPKPIVVLFCDENRQNEECEWYNDIYFHELEEEFRHHPYLKKEVITRVLHKLQN